MKRTKQMSFLAETDRLNRLSEIGDPLERITYTIDWELFRPRLEDVFRNEPKGPGGRPPMDRVMMFKIVMLQQWYRISDDMTEYVINDRLSFQRFLGLALDDKVPDAKTIWAFKERLKENGADLELFELFEKLMEQQGVVTRSGSLIDATFMDVPVNGTSAATIKRSKKAASPKNG